MENEEQNLLTTEFPTAFGIGRIIEKTKVYITSRGRVIELKQQVITMPDGRGNYLTNEKTLPSRLDDGILLTEETFPFIKECFYCGAVIVHFFFCSQCGHYTCRPCTAEIQYPPGYLTRMCKDCAERIEHPFLYELKKLFKPSKCESER